MKINKLTSIIAGICFLSFGVSAQYMGINELAIKKSDDPVVFFNAVKAFNVELVKQWLDEGYSLDYDKKGWCGITENGTTDYKGTASNEQEMMKVIQSGSFFQGTYQLPSTCQTMYLWRMLPGFNMIYSEDVAQYIPKIRQNSDYKTQMNILAIYNLISAKIKPEQYQVYFPVIINSRTLISLRQEALDKFLAGYKNKESLLSSEEKMYEKTMRDFYATKPGSRNDEFVFSVTNPGFVILDHLFEQFSRSESYYAKYYVKNKEKLNLPKFDVKTIKEGGVDLSKYDIDKMPATIAPYLVSANGYLKMMKSLMDSGIVDLNFQDSEGNTLMHNLFLKSGTFSELKYNEFAGSFIRYLLENGVNPLLKNKEDKTAYLLFEEAKGTDVNYPGVIQMSNAFIQRDYKED